MTYTYYAYSFTVVRTDGVIAEMMNHRLNDWVEVSDGVLWRRILEEGVSVSKVESEKLYREYHAAYLKSVK